MNGTSLQELMELGGWKSYGMVLRYAHLASEHLSRRLSGSSALGESWTATLRFRYVRLDGGLVRERKSLL